MGSISASVVVWKKVVPIMSARRTTYGDLVDQPPDATVQDGFRREGVEGSAVIVLQGEPGLDRVALRVLDRALLEVAGLIGGALKIHDRRLVFSCVTTDPKRSLSTGMWLFVIR